VTDFYWTGFLAVVVDYMLAAVEFWDYWLDAAADLKAFTGELVKALMVVGIIDAVIFSSAYISFSITETSKY